MYAHNENSVQSKTWPFSVFVYASNFPDSIYIYTYIALE